MLPDMTSDHLPYSDQIFLTGLDKRVSEGNNFVGLDGNVGNCVSKWNVILDNGVNDQKENKRVSRTWVCLR